jgi:DNA-binding NarL/FixJ family response regulator
MSLSAPPLRLAIVNDFEIVVAGVETMLAPYRNRVLVVELDSRVPALSNVDLVLVDTFSQVVGDGVDMADLVGVGHAKVVVFTWSSDPKSVATSSAEGVAGYLSKGLSALALVEALESVHHGRTIPSPEVEQGNAYGLGDWPGRRAGLSPREAEMLSFVAKGLSNQEIADAAYLSINSVKTYLRTSYRKIGVERRSQAVAWALGNGFEPERRRVLRP